MPTDFTKVHKKALKDKMSFEECIECHIKERQSGNKIAPEFGKKYSWPSETRFLKGKFQHEDTEE